MYMFKALLRPLAPPALLALLLLNPACSGEGGTPGPTGTPDVTNLDGTPTGPAASDSPGASATQTASGATPTDGPSPTAIEATQTATAGGETPTVGSSTPTLGLPTDTQTTSTDTPTEGEGTAGQTATPGGATASPGEVTPTGTASGPTPTPDDRDGDGYSIADGDCDDDDASRYPGAVEEPYDDIDQDCDGGDLTDVDGDTYDAEQAGGDDCNDNDPNTYPGADEFEDDADNDCDGQIDEGVDEDDDDGDGFSESQGDCDDTDASIFPGATETPYDGIDQDCNSGDLVDVDGDGFASVEVPGGDDCDDTDTDVNPEATEICDGVDNNCDRVIDTDAADRETYHPDVDQDGFGDANSTVLACSTGPGVVDNDQDCDDRDAFTHPDANEVCDSRDNDCDTSIDEGATLTFYADSDSDGFGAADVAQQACQAPDGYVGNSRDCDDDDGNVHPGVTEVCNLIDDNCNGAIDEGVGQTYYADADDDTFGSAQSTQVACEAPDGYVDQAGDCNDGDADVNPEAEEVCDEGDNDCDARVDEGVKTTWYFDSDDDTFGGESSFSSCTAPVGYVESGGDCDDNNALTYPGAEEQCGGDDNNCDGQAVPSAPLVAGNDGPACGGEDVQLSATTLDGASYSWEGPSGFTSSDQNPTLTGLEPAGEGTYTVTATVGACTFTESTDVDLTEVDGSFTGPVVAYQGVPVTFSAVQAGATYDWSFEGGNPETATEQSPAVSWADEGTYTITLTTTVGGCTDTSSAQVEVLDVSQGCAAVKAANPSAPTGVYQIDPDLEGPLPAIDAWCEMGMDDGGWTLMLNINTANGEISTLAQPIWTTTEEHGDFANRFSGDYKSVAAQYLSGTELLLIVRDANAAEGAAPVGWRSWYLDGTKRMNDFFSIPMGSAYENSTGGCNGGHSGDGTRQTTGIKSSGVQADYDPFTTAGDNVYTNTYYGSCAATQDGYRMSIWYRWSNNSNVGLGLQMDSNSQGVYSLEAGSYMRIDEFANPQRFCTGGCGSCTAFADGSYSYTKTLAAIGTDHYANHCSVGVSYRYEWYIK